jgi:hypothetical protein
MLSLGGGPNPRRFQQSLKHIFTMYVMEMRSKLMNKYFYLYFISLIMLLYVLEKITIRIVIICVHFL